MPLPLHRGNCLGLGRCGAKIREVHDLCRFLLAQDGEFERDLLPTGRHLVVMALGNEDHRCKIEAYGRNGCRQKREGIGVESRVSNDGSTRSSNLKEASFSCSFPLRYDKRSVLDERSSQAPAMVPEMQRDDPRAALVSRSDCSAQIASSGDCRIDDRKSDEDK
jgi:hypothetical protein